MTERAAVDGAWQRGAWIVEDEPAAASLATDLCEANGMSVSVFHLPLPFLTALRADPPPAVLVLDWRLQHELSAALFLATRHRHPQLPVIYWTGSPGSALPSMIRDDRWARVVDKAAGTDLLEQALAWALRAGLDPMLEELPAS